MRQRIADFIIVLLSMGISGVSIGAAKHIHLIDLVSILKKLKDIFGDGELPEDFIVYLEILFEGEKKPFNVWWR